MTTTQYPDSEAGAIACLAELSDHDLHGASAIPDPSVQGCWLVLRPTCEDSIVWLAGYPDLLGRKRTLNDFED